MAGWPTGADTRAWMRAEQFTVGDDANLDLVTAVATDTLRRRCSTDLLPPDPTICPAGVRLAIMMRAAQLYVRRDSPTGFIQFSPEQVYRVNRWDADIEFAVGPYLAAVIV